MDREELLRRAERWMAEDPDPRTVEELRTLLARPDLDATDLADRFAATLEFGTAGLRGVIGAGPNRMNRAVVARATGGGAQERRGRGPGGPPGGSPGAGGIRVPLSREPVPTPLVGFMVKRSGAA